jgi:hypothetical protein
VGLRNQRERKRSAGWAKRWRDGGGPSEGDRAARKGGRVSGGRKREGRSGPARGKGWPKGREEAGWAAWLTAFSNFLSFFFSTPFET